MSSQSLTPRTWSLHRGLLVLVHVALATSIIYLVVQGLHYYASPMLERPRQSDYWQLKPGGTRGLVFGYLGAGMMTVLLLYSVRKRLRPLRRLGSLSKWLDWHIVLGLYGPMFIVLHSSFKVGGLVSIAFWSMLTVASSGVFGRYLYLQIPRSRTGHALSLQQIRDTESELATEILEQSGLNADRLEALDLIAERTASRSDRTRRSLATLLIVLPLESLSLRRAIAREVGTWGLNPSLERQVTGLARRKGQLHARLLVLSRLQQLFHYWHVFHKPFALIMYLLVVVHIGVAWMTGYGGSF